MDALAHLALMTKAKLVFENPGTFLSFPVLSPMPYQASDLNSFGSSTATAAQLQVLSEFARVVNSCPLGTIFSMESDTYLWDIYRHVLTTAILASEAGNLALKVLATGGIYMAGGIALHLLSALQESQFMQTFTRKGRFKDLMARMPVHVITTRAALVGAATYGLENLKNHKE